MSYSAIDCILFSTKDIYGSAAHICACCIPTIEMICMLMMMHLGLASQQSLFIALTMLSTIKIHMAPYS